MNSILPPIFFGVGFFNKLSGIGMRSLWCGTPLEASLVPMAVALSARRFGDFRLGLAAAGIPDANVASVAKSKHDSKRVEHFGFIFCFILISTSLKNSHRVQTFWNFWQKLGCVWKFTFCNLTLFHFFRSYVSRMSLTFIFTHRSSVFSKTKS